MGLFGKLFKKKPPVTYTQIGGAEREKYSPEWNKLMKKYEAPIQNRMVWQVQVQLVWMKNISCVIPAVITEDMEKGVDRYLAKADIRNPRSENNLLNCIAKGVVDMSDAIREADLDSIKADWGNLNNAQLAMAFTSLKWYAGMMKEPYNEPLDQAVACIEEELHKRGF